jgi:hypothetical protein
MDASTIYLIVLVLGAVLVIADGQLIYRDGRRFLANAYGSDGTAGPMTHLLTALYHLATLGVLALVSTVDLAMDTPAQTIVARLGVALLITSVAHGITLMALSAVRNKQLADNVSARNAAAQETLPR